MLATGLPLPAGLQEDHEPRHGLARRHAALRHSLHHTRPRPDHVVQSCANATSLASSFAC